MGLPHEQMEKEESVSDRNLLLVLGLVVLFLTFFSVVGERERERVALRLLRLRHICLPLSVLQIAM